LEASPRNSRYQGSDKEKLVSLAGVAKEGQEQDQIPRSNCSVAILVCRAMGNAF
jgi:hypothetical protein